MALALARGASLVALIAASLAACQVAGATATPGGPLPTAFFLATDGAELPSGPPPPVEELPPTLAPDAGNGPFPDSHEDPELERLLAVDVAGTRLATSSRTGAEALAGGGYLPALLAALGKGEEDLATAFAADPAGNLQVVVFVARVRGAGAQDVLATFLGMSDLEGVEEVDVGGKRAHRIASDWTSYVYATNDMLIVVQALDPAHAEEALGQLP